MSSIRIRNFQDEDTDALLRLWQHTPHVLRQPIYALAEVLASCQKDHAVVAVRGGDVVGAAVGRAAHAQGWVVFLSTGSEPADSDLGGCLLTALEKRLVSVGLSKLSALLPDDAEGEETLLRRGFKIRQHVRYFEREMSVKRHEVAALSELGGRVLPSGLWDAIGGMEQEKRTIERRLVVPLARPDLAAQFGVVPPRSVMLFGPPGTGKTTFARAVASRLEWSFVEVFPSRLAADPQGLAGALRETFARIAELEHAVVFIDEVEEIAAQRDGRSLTPQQGVTNELLKIIPAFREQPNRLLICATNFIRSVDTALLRHGRFDYVLPIGLPDDAARRSIWQRYVPETSASQVDLATVVEASEGFSPADIEHASRTASQLALERALDSIDETDVVGPLSGDYLTAITGTRATVSHAAADEFLEDIALLARQ